MNKLFKHLIAFSLIVCAGNLYAASCTYTVGNNTTSGDAALSSTACRQDMINYFWNGYDFDKDDWDNGFGYEAACDINKPLARTFNALVALHYSAPSPATSSSDYSGNILRWGGNYAMNNIDELDGRCGDGSARATTRTGGLFVDEWTQLYMPFFYSENVIQRAGTILHESRHAGGKGHNGGSSCPRGSSCDSNWSYSGGNQYQALWLWWFRVEGRGWTSAMSQQAKDEANYVISTGFVTTPPYFVN